MRVQIAILLVCLIAAYGCSQKQQDQTTIVEPPVKVGGEPIKPAENVAATGNAAVDSVGAVVNDINSIEKELSDPSLDNLDKELTQLNW
jgi:hypothetical protein